jgi:hypothetical protein
MKGNSPDRHQISFLYQGLQEMLNPKEPLYQLTGKMPCNEIEKDFEKYYIEFGRPAKPVSIGARWIINGTLRVVKDVRLKDGTNTVLKM